MKNPRQTETWTKVAVNPLPFFPVQARPLFPLHKDMCRCHECK